MTIRFLRRVQVMATASAFVLLFLMSVGPSADDASASRKCKDVRIRAGDVHIHSIVATRVSCSRARRVARAYMLDTTGEHETYLGFSCKVSSDTGATCRNGKRRVSFGTNKMFQG